eukprot:1202631-Amphidinium_carterae.1
MKNHRKRRHAFPLGRVPADEFPPWPVEKPNRPPHKPALPKRDVSRDLFTTKSATVTVDATSKLVIRARVLKAQLSTV